MDKRILNTKDLDRQLIFIAIDLVSVINYANCDQDFAKAKELASKWNDTFWKSYLPAKDGG